MDEPTPFLIAIAVIASLMLGGCWGQPAQPYGEKIWLGVRCVEAKAC